MTRSMGGDIFGMLVVGLGAAAFLFAALHAARKAGLALPRWTMPAGIGAAMLVFTIWNEYTWFPRVRDQLPDRVQIIETGQGGKAWRPWAFVFPLTTRFAALEPLMEAPEDGGALRVRILLIERWQPTRFVTLDLDCAGARQRMVAADGTTLDWERVGEEDEPVLQAACTREETA